MGLTTKTGDSSELATVVGVTPPTTQVLNYTGGAGYLKQIYCKLPSNSKVLNIKITLDGVVIFDDLLENLANISKFVTTHGGGTYRYGHEIDLHFQNSINITIYGIKVVGTSSNFSYRVACTTICNAL